MIRPILPRSLARSITTACRQFPVLRLTGTGCGGR